MRQAKRFLLSEVLMKTLVLSLLLIPFISDAALTAPDYPGCNVNVQRQITGETGGSMSDPLQAHISVRANILQADIGTARKARVLTQLRADKLWQRVEVVRRDTDRLVQKQGFLSAAERASYDRELDDVAAVLCR